MMNESTNGLPYEVNIELQKNGLKLQQRNMANSDWEDWKYRRRELERELRKSQCEEIEIQNDGCVVVETKNLRVDFAPRLITNLSYPTLWKVIHAEKPNEFLYLLKARILDKHCEVFLRGDKLSSPRYILKKMTEIGAEFYGTEAEEKVNVRKFMGVLVRNVSECKWIPENPGWYITGDMNVKFYEKGERTWKQVKELAM